MCEKLELVREEKLWRLLPGMDEDDRLEASGIALVDDRTALVVFDNLNAMARVDLSLARRTVNRLIAVSSPAAGFEDVAVDPRHGRVFCLIEALEGDDGRFRGAVVEATLRGRVVRRTTLGSPLRGANKGVEGLAYVRRKRREYLLALREHAGRIEVFVAGDDGGWESAHAIRLPREAAFEDYASVALRDGRLAIVSQASARVWVGRLDRGLRAVVRGSGTVYRFPKKSYGNVEGIAWLDGRTLVAVSDRRKAGQPKRCARKDQSIHVFRIPAD
jgi:uncharacterized protein YjiK